MAEETETLPDNPTGDIDATHDFETLARSNDSSLPDHIKSMPPSDMYQIITSFSTNVTPSNEEKDPFYFRFQRSDQWMPVYKWLETLKTDEIVNKKEVQDWLTENAEIMKDVSSRHTRYHLVHYIRKCHKKILKKREKKEGLHLRTTIKKSSSKAHKTEEKKSPAVPPSSSATKLPKDSPTYMVKRNEAFQKYQILTEMEKQLGVMFQNQETTKVVTGP